MTNGNNGGYYPPAWAAPKVVHIEFKNNWIGHVHINNAASADNGGAPAGGGSGYEVNFNFGGDQSNEARATAISIGGDTTNIQVEEGPGNNTNVSGNALSSASVDADQSNEQ